MFKSLPNVLVPDDRYKAVVAGIDASGHIRPWTLEEQHKLMNEIVLATPVPDSIREKFDAARNTFVYAWFDYELHTVAEQYGYIVVEMALKERHRIASVELPKRRGLVALVHSAIKHRWIQTNDYKIDAPHMQGGSFSILDFMSMSRNHIAHGNPHLSPGGSCDALAWCAYFINQLFTDTGPANS